ncbi:GTP-binding protein [Thermoactinospora rubra]|uniref:GTP-binding protein n=1 Tax=Thermoactinospora rubra TaxID=1088767 RepID=UPI001F0B45AC|nr:GTP-binding protein [Thermoactinospora rubra]
MSTPVVLVAGLHAPARIAVVDQLLGEHPGALSVHHDLKAITQGRIERVVRDGDRVLDRTEVRLAHGCITCTVREDLLPWLVRHAGQATLLVVDLWDSVEPRSVAEAIDCEEAHDLLRLTGVLTALDAEHLPVDIVRGDNLADSGHQAAAGDRRYLAEVLARQLEYATALVLRGGDTEDRDLSRAILTHLAPCTPVFVEALPEVTGASLCTRELAERVDPPTAQLPCDAQTGEITTVVWRRLRPLHPGRFFAAVDELATGSVRSRGRFWLATQPDRILAWDAVAGVVSVEDCGPWLISLPEAAWELMSPARRLIASLDWNPIIGDRVQHLVFMGPDLDRERLLALLDSCLLTPDEAETPLEDPFVPLITLKESA